MIRYNYGPTDAAAVTSVASEQQRLQDEEMRARTTVPPVSSEEENWCTGCGGHYAASPFRLCPVCDDKRRAA